MTAHNTVIQAIHGLVGLLPRRLVESHLEAGVCLAGAYIAARIAWRVLHQFFFGPLSRLPGTALSRVTNIQAKLDAALGNTGERAQSDYYKYGDIYRIGPRTVVISNPADCKTVLGSHEYRKGRVYQNFAVVEDTMFTTTSAELSHMRRKLIGPAFNGSFLCKMEPTVLECGILALKEKWDEALARAGGVEARVNYAAHFSLVAFDTISALGFGQRFHALRNDTSKMVHWMEDAIKFCALRVLFRSVTAFPVGLFTRRLARSVDEFIAFGGLAIDTRKELLRTGAIERPRDILQTMIDAEDPVTKTKMTRSEITGENITFLLAGTDTTSLTMVWTMHYLLLHPDIYARAVAEVRREFSRDHLIRYAEAKARLPYIEACIYEALRIHAATGSYLVRIVPSGGAVFQGHFIPGGTQICVNVAGANHHQGTWREPRRFVPERFLDDEKARHRILTFSSGVRICPGRHLAHYEMMTAFANLLKDYDISLPPDALFTHDRLDEHGHPRSMPTTHGVTSGPKYPDRDCCILIRPAPRY